MHINMDDIFDVGIFFNIDFDTDSNSNSDVETIIGNNDCIICDEWECSTSDGKAVIESEEESVYDNNIEEIEEIQELLQLEKWRRITTFASVFFYFSFTSSQSWSLLIMTQLVHIHCILYHFDRVMFFNRTFFNRMFFNRT